MKKLFISILSIASVFVFAVTVNAATSVVHPGDMQGWGFVQESATGTGVMVNGPVTPPLGAGSANLTVDSTGGMILAKAGYLGLELSDINTLEYSTYRTSGGPALAIALQLNFDANVTDTDNAWQGRLVYEPYHTQTVNTGEWQTWDALDDAAGTATGNWWFSNNAHATSSGCTMATPCTWAEVKAAFPNGGVHPTLGAVVLKAGSGWTGGFDGNVDALIVNDDVYDFELDAPVVRDAVITAPTPGDTESGMVDFEAYLVDDDVDSIQWAVRQDTCSGTTIFGNVDGKSDVASIDTTDVEMQTFSFTGDMSAMTPGTYCFIYNPAEDSGEAPIRETVQFNLIAPEPEFTTPSNMNECKNGGWMDVTDSNGNAFKNQGQCVSYVQANEKAGKQL